MPRLENPDFNQVHIRLPAELYEAAQRAAKEDNRSFAGLARQALEEFLLPRGYLSPDA